MSVASELLPLEQTVSPSSVAAASDAILAARNDGLAVYPVGGATALDFGMPATRPGVGVVLTEMNQIVDYPARDMTITVQAGITMQSLAETLRAERQRLPIDVPGPEQATLGGVLATNTSGPRRYGLGTIRDYVIGISAIDGRGIPFKGGGRVVKNVAGYDFCKLLCGSCGTLGLVTQVTLKVIPQAERSALVRTAVPDLAAAETVLSGLVHSQTTPVAIELLVGPHWDVPGTSDGAAIVVGVEGSDAEVAWMLKQLKQEWAELGLDTPAVIEKESADELWARFAEFPRGQASPLVLQASVLPSEVTQFATAVREIDAGVDILAHAGSGAVLIRFQEFSPADVSAELIARLQPLAARSGGYVAVLSTEMEGLTRQVYWGARRAHVDLVRSVRQQFDPDGLFNPGRFIE